MMCSECSSFFLSAVVIPILEQDKVIAVLLVSQSRTKNESSTVTKPVAAEKVITSKFSY